MSERTHDQVVSPSIIRGSIRPLFIIALLSIAALTVSSCLFTPEGNVEPTGTPSAPSASIRGRVALDHCEPSDVCPTTTPDFTQNTSDQSGDGLQGMDGVDVLLGFGPCPSVGLTSFQTARDGLFNFPNLQPGFYCLSVRVADSMAGQWVSPILPPSERSASYTIALGPGEQRQDLQFVWRPGNQETPIAPTPTATATPSCSNQLSLVDDVTIEDGERIDPKVTFTKTWRIRNEGSCTWSREYSWVFVSGYQLFAPETLQLPTQVRPGEMIDISLQMTAPAVSGNYRSYWMMRSLRGELFGAGVDFNRPIYVDIKVGPEPTPVITHWRAEYFNNRNLDGSPSLIRNDKEIDFDWGRKSPADGIQNDNFSARWSRTLEFDAAIYRFTVASDDGVRFWVDDRLVIDEWNDSGQNQASVDLALVSGKHDLKLEYYESRGDADVELSWKEVTHDDDDQWVARFWFNRTRDSKWALVRTTSEIDYDWGSKSPAPAIPADEFSASWTRTVDFESAKYRFSVRADDGVRLYLDDDLIIDEWHDASASETYSAERELSGSHKLQVIFYERKGNARIEFDWTKSGPPNRAPVALSDGYETMVDTPINVIDPGILGNDTDPDEDALRAILISNPEHGELILHENGAFSYQPNAGYVGQDSFVYRASDGKLESEDALVKFTIQREDQLPAAVDDTVETDEDNAISIDVLANDRGLGDTPIQIINIGTPSAGDNSLSGGNIVYTPNPNFSGKDNFTYTIADRDGDQSSAIVTVNVIAFNDAPEAAPESYELNEDETLTIPAPGVLGNDSDVEGSELSAILVGTVSHGQLELNTDGSFTYTPDTNFNGEDSFTYKASDSEKSSAAVQVMLLITPLEDNPIAIEDSYSILLEPELTVAAPGVLANDLEPDGDEMIAVLDQGPSNGSLDFNADGSFNYIPAFGFSGTDQFTYWIEDGKGRSPSVSVTIEVAGKSSSG